MELIDWLIACIPILSFGLLPVVATWIGGKPVEQSMGVALGSFVFALLVFLIRKPDISTHIFLIGLFSGIFWSIGSIGQFMGLTYLGVSKSMPVSNGGQIIGTSLMGVMLGDWATSQSKMFGFAALALIIVGIIFTSYHDSGSKGPKPQWKKGLLVNLVSALGFTFYVGILKYFSIDGWSSILPQSIGQVLGIVMLGILFFKMQPITRLSLKNSLGGIIWAVGNIALLISQVKIGLAVAYPFSQAAIIVSVLGGVFINKEHKSRREWLFTGIGMVVILAGLYLIYLSSLHDVK